MLQVYDLAFGCCNSSQSSSSKDVVSIFDMDLDVDLTGGAHNLRQHSIGSYFGEETL